MKKIFMLAAAVLSVTVSLTAQEAKMLQPFRVGGYEVYVLVEDSGTGNTDILIDTPPAVLEEYAPGGVFSKATNAVLIKGPGEIWLVDTGYGRNIFNQMAELGVSPEEVDYVLLTHMHGDHIGGMFRDGEKAFPNATVVVSEKEYEYWSGKDEMNKLPEERRGSFTAAQKVFSEYGDRLVACEPYEVGEEAEESKGIRLIAAYGHTPGHIMYMLSDGGHQLLIWGDLTHAMAVQMPHPEISVTYDVNPGMARESRMNVLQFIAANEGTPLEKITPVIGMHIPAVYPGVIYRDGGGYRFEMLPVSEK